MKLQPQIKTRLEEAQKEEIVPILEQKLQDTSIEGMVDYIGLAVDLLEDRIKRIDASIEELKALKAVCKMQIDNIKEEANNLLLANGVTEKVYGERISSISPQTEAKPKYKAIIHDADALIELGFIKYSVDTTAVKNALLEGDETITQYATLEIEQPTPKIKINKRRGGN